MFDIYLILGENGCLRRFTRLVKHKFCARLPRPRAPITGQLHFLDVITVADLDARTVSKLLDRRHLFMVARTPRNID